MKWTSEQSAALRAVQDWLTNRQQLFRLFGYAGTGKTTLAQHVAKSVQGSVIFGAYTGKAALVMRNKGCEGASTIHSMIYRPVRNEDGGLKFVLDRDNSPASKARLIIIDECSMVGQMLGKDLLSFGRKILVLGDPMQLPPISGTGFFTQARPDVMLNEVNRQAQNDPIIKLSMDARAGKPLAIGRYERSRVIHARDIDVNDVLDADQVLVGRNQTRQLFNRRIRELLGRHGPLPETGDKLACLRNRPVRGLFNGGLYDVVRVSPKGDKLSMHVTADHAREQQIDITVHQDFFLKSNEELEQKRDSSEMKRSDEFTYGYALTVHKAQGSQWNNVVIFDESDCFPAEQQKNLLYTALTRASERVTLVRRH